MTNTHTAHIARINADLARRTATASQELAQEFNAYVPNWEVRLAEHDATESDLYVSESDLSDADTAEASPVRDWDAFMALTLD